MHACTRAQIVGWRMIPCVALISWALLSIEEVGNTIEDPFNMPFLFEGGQRDELQLERSFQNIRGDILDRSPACIPPAMSQERATGGGEGEQDQQVPQALLQTLLAVPAFMQYENQTQRTSVTITVHTTDIAAPS